MSEQFKNTLEEVRFQGLKAGAAGILGKVLEMCNTGEAVDDIRDFCVKSLDMGGMKDK